MKYLAFSLAICYILPKPKNLLLCDQHSFFCAFLYFCVFKYSSSANTIIADLEKPLLLAKSTNIWCCSSVKLTCTLFLLVAIFFSSFGIAKSVPLVSSFVNVLLKFLFLSPKMSPKCRRDVAHLKPLGLLGLGHFFSRFGTRHLKGGS